MRWTIFSRLVIGYLAIFILVTAASVYAIAQLYRFNRMTRALQTTDNQMIDFEKTLRDALLSEIRYERKFVITRDPLLHQQFLVFAKDFEAGLGDARAIARDPEAKRLLDELELHHRLYQDLVRDERDLLESGRGYNHAQFRQAKEWVADEAMEGLAAIKAHSQKAISDKIARLDTLGARARDAAMVLTGGSLILGLLISLFITRSITRPIATMERKTREVSRGDFRWDLTPSSPPEIAALARAFKLMCDRLGELDRMKSDFFSTMSHELRTPLTSIKEGIALLLENAEGPMTGKEKRVLAIIREESDRLITLVTSLLDLSKMEAGMLDYSFEPANLVELIEKVATEIAPLAESKRIRVETQASPDLPTVRVDIERILQALRNLVGNAVKFTPEGGRVTVSARPAKGEVEVSVTDTGPGIPSENLVTIFNKFQQGTAAGSSRSNGTGLGLAIAQHIVSSHGGRICAESNTGQGSTFTFVLPA